MGRQTSFATVWEFHRSAGHSTNGRQSKFVTVCEFRDIWGQFATVCNGQAAAALLEEQRSCLGAPTSQETGLRAFALFQIFSQRVCVVRQSLSRGCAFEEDERRIRRGKTPLSLFWKGVACCGFRIRASKNRIIMRKCLNISSTLFSLWRDQGLVLRFYQKMMNCYNRKFRKPVSVLEKME